VKFPKEVEVSHVLGIILTLLSDEFNSPTQRVFEKGSRSALQSAADHLREVLRSSRARDEIDEGELSGFQWRSFKAHCASSGLILSVPADLKKGGTEHDFLYDQERILKFTQTAMRWVHWYCRRNLINDVAEPASAIP
jgi:hypothetical protein